LTPSRIVFAALIAIQLVGGGLHIAYLYGRTTMRGELEGMAREAVQTTQACVGAMKQQQKRCRADVAEATAIATACIEDTKKLLKALR
jgi:hypothetical protein